MAGARDGTDLDVDPERVAAWLQEDPQLQLVDVREPHEHQAGHIEGARHVPLAQLPSQVAAISSEHTVVFYCRVGSRSTMAAQALRASGYQAYSMSGGLRRWAQEGRPLVPEAGYVADD